MGYTITDAKIEGDKIVWMAENDEGDTLRGTLTHKSMSGAILTSEAMNELVEDLIGKPIVESESGGLMGPGPWH